MTDKYEYKIEVYRLGWQWWARCSRMDTTKELPMSFTFATVCAFTEARARRKAERQIDRDYYEESVRKTYSYKPGGGA